MKSYLNKIISVLMCLTMMFAIAVPLCVPVSSEEGTGAGGAYSEDGIELTKSYDASTGLLTLEAYVTGYSVTTTTTTFEPTDVILVLDQSGSMVYKDNGYSADTRIDDGNGNKISKLDALRNSVTAFMNFVSESDRDIRVAAVGFSDGNRAGKDGIYYYNTELFNLSQNTVSKKRYNEISSYSGVFGSAQSFDSAKISNFVSNICSDDLDTVTYNTYHDLGLEMALNVINSRSTVKGADGKSEADRKCIVIMFTDGEPYKDSEYGDTKKSVACNAINNAKSIKDKGATVYTVGIFDGANVDHDIGYKYSGSSVLSASTMLSGFNKSGTTSVYARNLFLHFLSSNYPTASALSVSPFTVTPGDRKSGNNYFPVLNDASLLTAAFEGIASQVVSGGATTVLEEETELRDVISNKFVYDTTNDKKAHVYYADYIGENQWGELHEFPEDSGVTIDDITNPKTVSVTGFSYSDNWCGTSTVDGVVSYRGRKVVLTIPIKPADGAEGESGVNTNDPTSGIIPEPGKDPVQNFPVPTTDLPTDIKIIKRFDGDYIPSSKTFELAASVTDYITGYLPADADNYTKATTAPNSYDNIILGKDGEYSDIKNILVKSDKRSSSVTVTEKAVPVGYTVTIAAGDVSETFIGTGADVSKTFDVIADMEITVTNKKLNPDTTTVTIEEYVTGYGDINKSFSFDTSYNSAGTPETDNFSIKNGETHAIGDVDVTKDGTVIIKPETVEGYTTKVMVGETEYSPDENGKFVIPVVENMRIKVIHDKASPDTADIDFKMLTGGNMGDKAQQFTVTGTPDDFSYKMKHGDTEKLADIPIGSTVKFKVGAPEDYTDIKVLINDKEVTPINGEYIFDVDGETTVSITCSRDALIDTGIVLDSVPYVIIVIMVVLGISAIIIRKKKKE